LIDDCGQSEISRRREHEVQKLKKDLELISIQYETSEASLKKRHQEAINDLTDQLEQLNRQRNKYVGTSSTLFTLCIAKLHDFCILLRGAYVKARTE